MHTLYQHSRTPHAPPLARLVFALISLFALLIVGFKALGSTQPPPATLAYLHLNDCTLPCWLGIVPGETRFNDAIQRVTEANPTTTFTSGIGSGTTSAYQMGSTTIQAGIYADRNGLVSQITLLTSNVKGITFGDVVTYLGAPACTVRYPASAIYLSDTGFAVLIGARTDRGWRTPLNHIEIRSFTGSDQPCTEVRS